MIAMKLTKFLMINKFFRSFKFYPHLIEVYDHRQIYRIPAELPIRNFQN